MDKVITDVEDNTNIDTVKAFYVDIIEEFKCESDHE
jgi:hypothetical protein